MRSNSRFTLVLMFNIAVCALCYGVGLNYGLGPGLIAFGFCYAVIIGLVLLLAGGDNDFR